MEYSHTKFGQIKIIKHHIKSFKYNHNFIITVEYKKTEVNVQQQNKFL